MVSSVSSLFAISMGPFPSAITEDQEEREREARERSGGFDGDGAFFWCGVSVRSDGAVHSVLFLFYYQNALVL